MTSRVACGVGVLAFAFLLASSASAQIIYEPVQSQYNVGGTYYYYGGSNPLVHVYAAQPTIAGETWGREVTIDAAARRRIVNEVERRNGSCAARRDMTVALPASRWRELGVRTAKGDPLPEGTPDAALVTGESRTFLVFHNYDALLEYNCAHSYAIGVGLLADSLITGEAPVAPAVAKKAPRKTKQRRKATKKS